MVIQYPYWLYKKRSTATQNATGDYTPGNESWVTLGFCRDKTEPKTIQAVDGIKRAFQSVIYVPARVDIQAGDYVQVRTGTGIRIEGTVVRYEHGQLHGRIWL